jgi:hypothetical protein
VSVLGYSAYAGFVAIMWRSIRGRSYYYEFKCAKALIKILFSSVLYFMLSRTVQIYFVARMVNIKPTAIFSTSWLSFPFCNLL